MDTNAQIISDLNYKIGSHQSLDLLSDWKGVPVMVRAQIQETRSQSVVFKVEPPDSICFTQQDHALILHDIFIMGIQGRILAFDPKSGTAELGEFIYIDRGYGERVTVRVEPDYPIAAELVLPNSPIPAELILETGAISCQVIDISLNGFGLLAKPTASQNLYKGQTITLKLCLMDKKIEIPGTLLGIFQKADEVRLAMSFSQNAPNHAIVARYITRRRAEIRQEIQATYDQAVK